MQIGGLKKFSLIDYPGKVSAVVFTQGCNFRCPFCHNPELVLPKLFRESIPMDEILEFLENRKGKIDGVVVTGGEPTIQPGLLSFLRFVKDLGYFVKLDTNGTNPEVINQCIGLGLVDFFAMDIKAPFEKYEVLAGIYIDLVDIIESKSLIINSGIDYQFRTTFAKDYLDEEDIDKIKVALKGVKDYKIQEYVERQNGTLSQIL